MSSQEINNLKSLLQKHGGAHFIDPSSGNITEDGFVFLMQIFVMKDHTETVWVALRKFKFDLFTAIRCSYDDSFHLLEGVTDIPVGADQSVELSSEARVFLTSVMYVVLYDW